MFAHAAREVTRSTSQGNGVTLPVVVTEVKPAYTREAMQQLIQGTVWLLCVVDESGNVTDVVVSQSLDTEFGLDKAAIAPPGNGSSSPGARTESPWRSRSRIEMTFTLR